VDAVGLAKRARASRSANALVRRALRALLRGAGVVEQIAGKWRVNGAPTIPLHGTSFRMLGRSDDQVLDALYYGFEWEAAETRLFAMLVQDAAVVLDLGANTGVYTLMSTRASPDVRVIAVEPGPANAERLRTNLRLNGGDDRVTTVEAAVGSAQGTLALTVPADGAISDVASPVDAFARAHWGIDYTTVTVVQTTVDQLVADHRLDHVDLIKLDVECFELPVLEGAQETLATFAPVVLAEVFDHDVLTGNWPELKGRIPADGEQVEALMGSHGYAFFAIGERGVLRVQTLRGIPDGRSNYLFVKAPPDERYIPYTDEAAIRALMRPGY
jgi:FkbM family methyltransferase